MDIRQRIIEQMEREGITTYRLAKRCGGMVPQRTVYDFITGNSATINSDALGHILAAAGLQLMPSKRKERNQ